MIREEKASTLSEYFEKVKEIRHHWNPTRNAEEEIWFRGQPKRTYKLLPGIYRKEAIEYGYQEEDLVERFKVLAALHAGTPPFESDWDWYFMAQHYGLPTRLLDWTESALTGIYFAVCEDIEALGRHVYEEHAAEKRKTPVYSPESPVVWLMDAGTLNQASFGEDSDIVLTVGGERTDHYLELKESPTEFEINDRKLSNRYPIAILPFRRTPRIVSQQGTFTLHGFNRTPIDDLKIDDQHGIKLACIILDKANLCLLWDEIELTGISRLILFPELENIAPYLKWVCCRGQTRNKEIE